MPDSATPSGRQQQQQKQQEQQLRDFYAASGGSGDGSSSRNALDRYNQYRLRSGNNNNYYAAPAPTPVRLPSQLGLLYRVKAVSQRQRSAVRACVRAASVQTCQRARVRRRCFRLRC